MVELVGVSVTAAGLRGARLDPPVGEAPGGSILEGVSLSAKRGEVYSLLGESGGGKSTLLRLINRLVEAEQGRVAVLGVEVAQWEPQALRRAAVYVAQRAPPLADTVAADLRRALRWCGRQASDEALRQCLARARLAGLELGQPAAQLSEGERTRLGLARAMLLEPEILLLDEPTGALDVKTARLLLEGLIGWGADTATTLIVVTHRPEDLATLGGRAGLLLGGRLHGPFAASDLAPGHDPAALPPAVASFLGSLEEDGANGVSG